jgi:deoxyribodipyrimidine photo-lyase
MQRAQRSVDNPALDVAIELGNALDKPVVVFFGLNPFVERANLRHYQFLVEGLADIADGLRRRRVGLVLRRHPDHSVIRFAEQARAAIVIGDENPLRQPEAWRVRAADALRVPLWTVDADVVVPSLLLEKEQYAARTIRPRIMGRLAEFLTAPAEPTANVAWCATGGLTSLSLDDDLLDGLPIDRSVSPVTSFRGGTREARRRLRRFVEERAAAYGEARNHPELDGTSELSPYLHFGHIGPREVALAVRASGAPPAEVEPFIEQLVVRRELAVNFVTFNPRYDRLAGCERWALDTLRRHQRDRRVHLYSRDQFEAGATHDPLWNAAQHQMVATGWMHGYMRMYWAKKILEWSPSAEDAFDTAVTLNDKYELDGRDPNGYTNIAWAIGGKHDRPWPERAVYGTVRAMSSDRTMKKFDAPRYIHRWGRALLLLILLMTGVPLAAQDTAGVGVIRGQVADAQGRAVPDVAVCITSSGQCGVSGADGRFAIAGVRAGTYRLEIVAPGRPMLVSQDIEVRAGLEATVEVELPEVGAVEEGVVVTAPTFAFPEEVKTSGFLVSAGDVAGSAGALQDVSRYVQTLPGVAIGSNDFRNDLIVRGGSPLENLYIVDNIEIPNINTFATFASAGGTVSMLDAALIQDVTFLTGGYPASYVNRTSSVLHITQREGDRERVRGRATLGFAGAGAVAEGPIGDAGRGSWVASVRRSFLDLFTDDVGIGGVPVLYTFNAKAVYDLSPRDRIWAVNLSGVDDIRLGLTEDSDLSEELSTLDITYAGRRAATGINWQRLIGTRGVGLFGVTYSRAAVHQQVTDLLRGGVPPPGTPVEEQLAGGQVVFQEESTEGEATVKYDLTAYVPRLGKVQTGASVKRFTVRYDAASPFGTDSPFFPVADVNPFSLRDRRTAFQTGGYVQATREITSRLSATAGARVDRYEELSATRVSPRIAFDYALTDRLSLRLAHGRYFQQPFFLFLTAYPENGSLRPFRADHFVGGLSWRVSETTRVTVETYRKVYRDYPVSSQIPSLSLANVGDTFAIRDILFPMVSAGRGRAEGVEIFAERKPDGGRWHGQGNVALSRVRHGGLDGVLRPGSFDYPVVANLLGGYQFTPRWDVSVRLAYLAGRPATPFDLARSTAQRRAVYDLSRVNALRAPDYVRLDLRVDRHLVVAGREVSLFAGVQNVTNRRNIAGYAWDRRNNVARANEQLGLFPILGLDWRF